MTTGGPTKAQLPSFKAELWDPGEYIVTMDGRPIGMTASKADAQGAAYWLNRGGWQRDLAGPVAACVPTLGAASELADALRAVLAMPLLDGHEKPACGDASCQVRRARALLARLDGETT